MLSRRSFTRTVLSSLTALALARGKAVQATDAGTPLLKPAAMGDLALANRMIMAPMTRGRAGEQRTATALMAEYYSQRAGAGLIVTEGTAISEQGYGWMGSPGIYTQAHALGWKEVTAAVHQRGGRIFLQLWHTGRVSHPDFLGSADRAIRGNGLRKRAHAPRKEAIRDATPNDSAGDIGHGSRLCARHTAGASGWL
jgi:2,4-dienoyl-CoA reductase-like NADH-dependent reductase (Old Yellow Enzyme family)